MRNTEAFELLIDMISELESARDILSELDDERAKRLTEKIEETLVVQHKNDNEMLMNLDFELKYDDWRMFWWPPFPKLASINLLANFHF